MSDMKHTKGDWEYDQESDHTFWVGVNPDMPTGLICEIVDQDGSEETLVNAKLIAQSPVMYTFIVDYIDAMEDKGKLTIHETALLDSAKQIVKQLS